MMPNDSQVKPGKVTKFDPRTGRGTVSYDDGDSVGFGKSSFDSGAPFRFPREGDRVEVVVTGDDRLLRVRRRD